MLYDPFLRKDSFADMPWYNEFLTFFAIGVCQAEEKNVKEIRKSLARFLYATRAIPHFEMPGIVMIVSDGAIDIADMGAYIIKRIHGE